MDIQPMVDRAGREARFVILEVAATIVVGLLVFALFLPLSLPIAVAAAGIGMAISALVMEGQRSSLLVWSLRGEGHGVRFVRHTAKFAEQAIVDTRAPTIYIGPSVTRAVLTVSFAMICLLLLVDFIFLLSGLSPIDHSGHIKTVPPEASVSNVVAPNYLDQSFTKSGLAYTADNACDRLFTSIVIIPDDPLSKSPILIGKSCTSDAVGVDQLRISPASKDLWSYADIDASFGKTAIGPPLVTGKLSLTLSTQPSAVFDSRGLKAGFYVAQFQFHSHTRIGFGSYAVAFSVGGWFYPSSPA